MNTAERSLFELMKKKRFMRKRTWTLTKLHLEHIQLYDFKVTISQTLNILRILVEGGYLVEGMSGGLTTYKVVG